MQLLDYERYMLTSENINRFFPYKNTSNKEVTSIKKEKKIINNEDLLFWTIYKIVNKDLINTTSSNFKTEKDFKIKSIEDLRKIKSKLKTYKISLIDVENQLLNDKKIGLQAFFALALLFDLNIFYITNNKFYEFNCNPDSSVTVIKNNSNNITIEDNGIDYYRENYFQIENLSKPIKSITSYNKNELLVIAKKLNVNDIQDKINKKDLYEKILTKI